MGDNRIGMKGKAMKKFWIVYKFKTDGSTFLPCSMRFDRQASAEDYAKREALADYGADFIVFESVSIARRWKPEPEVGSSRMEGYI